MAWKLEIAATDRTSSIHRASGVTISQPYNERQTAKFTTKGGYIPAMFDEVYIYDTDGTTKIFGGLVIRRAGRMVTQRNITNGLLVDVECVDWSVYLDWRTVTGGYVGPATTISTSSNANPTTITTATAHALVTGDTVEISGHSIAALNTQHTATVTGSTTFTIPVASSGGSGGQVQRLTVVTLKRILQDAITYALGDYGITLDGAQATGPTGASSGLSWVDKKISDVFRDLTALSGGYLYSITPNKVLSMVLPGSVSAPFSMTDANPRHMTLAWDDTREDYANRIVLHAGETGDKAITESFVLQSGQNSYTTNVPAVANSAATATVNGTPWTVGPVGGNTQLYWTWQTHTLTAGQQAPNVGDTVAVTFTATLPFTVRVGSGSPIVEKVVRAPEVTAYQAALDLANALLNRFNQTLRTLQIVTRVAGFAPGQTLTVNLTGPQVNSTFTIINREAALDLDRTWRYTLTCISGIYQSSELDYFRSLQGDNAGRITAVALPQTGGSDTIIERAYAFLGGSRNTAIAKNPAAWADVVGFVPYVPPIDFTALVRVDLWARNASVSATARLWDVTSGSAAGTSSAVTAQVATAATFFAPLVAGHRYVLQVLNGTNSEAVYCVGSLESVSS